MFLVFLCYLNLSVPWRVLCHQYFNFCFRFLASLQLFSFFIASLVSIYLGFILYAVLQDLCVVCVATYVVNFLLLTLSYFNRRSIRPPKPTSKRRDEPIIGNFKKNIWKNKISSLPNLFVKLYTLWNKPSLNTRVILFNQRFKCDI